jgi:hypothetical protein
MSGTEMERIGYRIMGAAAFLWGVILVGFVFQVAVEELNGTRGSRMVWPLFGLGIVGVLMLIGGPLSLVGQSRRFKEEDRRRY